MAYSWQSDIIRPDGENGTEVLDGQGVFQPQIEGGDNITIENGRINASGTLENVQADYTETDASAPSYIKHKPDLSIYATASGMETALAGKQDVIDDLSTIRSGAEAGSTAVQPGDLAEVATTGSYTSLSNTPQNIVQDASYVHTDNNFSNADKSKLDGIAAGAEVNVQADWNEADSSSDAYIANKPTIPAAQVNSDWNASSGVSAILNKPDLSAYATDSELTDGLATKQDVISDLDTIRAGAAAGATAAQPSDLPSSDELLPSASSGDAGKILSVDASGNPEWITPSGGTTYSAGDGIGIDANNVISADVDGTTIGIDASTKKIKSLQTIPTKTSDLQNDSNFVVASSLATVATSGSYADLSNKPNIPTKTSDLQNDSNFVSSSSLATVATTGSYNDLSDKPVIPPGVTVDQTYNAASTNAQAGVAVAQAIAGVNQVPASTSSDENKVLTVNSSGNPVWEASAVPASKTLVAGSNITITENTNDVTISATDTTYTAGDGIDITSGVVSADVDGTTIGIDASTKKIKLLSTIPTVDQHYSASSTNAQSGTAVAEALGSSSTLAAGNGVTLTESSGTLTIAADVDNVTIGFDSTTHKIKSLQTVPSVDQTYNSASTNAQSGVAVASAISGVNAVPASTSVDSGKVLTVDSQGAPVWGGAPAGTAEFVWSTVTKADVEGAIAAGKLVVITDDTFSDEAIKCYLDDIQTSSSGSDYYFTSQTRPGSMDAFTQNATVVRLTIYLSGSKFREVRSVGLTLVSEDNSVSIADGTIQGQLNITTNAVPTSTSSDADKVLTVDSNGTPVWAASQGGGGTVDQTYNSSSTNAQSGTAVAGALATVNQVPASTSSDADKVLTVNSSGVPVWEDASVPYSKPLVAGSNITITDGANDVTIAATDTTYTAGNMIAIDANNSNAIGVSTTAGITDIQIVNALPASPVATVLYLIQET